MANKLNLNDIDKAAFEAAMKGVKRLTQPKKQISAPPKTLIQRRIQPSKPEKIPENNSDLFQFSDYETLNPVKGTDFIEFSRSGIQPKTLRQMRKGHYTIEASLDLHGMIITEARNALSHFLMECHRQGVRHVLIIHGKGRAHPYPILKNKLNHWLRQTDDILAFCSVSTRDGSSGAMHVLLKRTHSCY